MATIRLSTPAANAMLDAIATLMDVGAGPAIGEIYDGAIPTNADTAIGAQVKLATVTFSNPCVAGAAAARVLTFDTITPDSAADATGTAAWVRVLDSAGVKVFDGTVTATGGGGVIEFNSTSFVATVPVYVTSGALSFATP